MTRPLEDVWDYPRPPRLERVPWHVRVEHRRTVIADAAEVHRVLETTHPPVYYVPWSNIARDTLRPSRRAPTWCEWKGQARYFDLVVADDLVEAACWSFAEPAPGFEPIAGAVAFYPSKVDHCSVDGERVKPQPGDFYGGWITSWISGGERGFKGGAGTLGW